MNHISDSKSIPPFRTGADLLQIQEIGKIAICDECGMEGHENVGIKRYYRHGHVTYLCHDDAVRVGLA